jgi:tetraacyldisaccharide 4'-kinase
MVSLLLKHHSRVEHNDSRPGFGEFMLAPLLPAAYLYGLGMRARAKLYAIGMLQQQMLASRVISVGNLSVGGTGKTPVVIALANALQRNGRHVGVISRGYGRRREDAILEVSDGRSVLGDPVEVGDEPLLIAERCPGVAVAVGANRYKTGQYVLSRFNLDTLLLDDGFQHLALKRDVDIVVVDATEALSNDYLLPRGRLREPLSALRRASLALVTRARQVSNLRQQMKVLGTVAPELPVCLTDFKIVGLWKLGTRDRESESALKGQRVVAMSGIGNPQSFQTLLTSLGAIVLDHAIFPDHHYYTREEVRRVVKMAEQLRADRIVTTEKDAMKLNCIEEIRNGVMNLWAVRIDVEWLEGREHWERIVLQS